MKLITAFVLVAATTTALAQTAQTRTKNYCAGLTALDADLDQLQALPPDATAADLNAVVNRVDKDVRLIEQDITRRDTPEARQFMASAEDVTQVRQSSDALRAGCAPPTAP
jgi:hypothetical protein